MSRPKSPTNLKDPIALADWLELLAIDSDDGNSSDGDLRSLLQPFSDDPSAEADQTERTVALVFDEIASRQRAAQQAYPFSLDGSVLELRGDWESFPAYSFCLCVSYHNYGDRDRGGEVKQAPEKLFEYVARAAAQHFVGGHAVRFGWPRSAQEFPRSFIAAIDKLCSPELLNEGGGFRTGEKPRRAKDDGVDVIAWPLFPDGLPGKFVLFGNCATGENWEDKKYELQPRHFCEKWFAEGHLTSRSIESLFVPHRIPLERWAQLALDVGVVFDRCRTAHWADAHPWDAEDHLAWTKRMLDR